MENITEKKWFIYMGDHHEGPFSVGEIHTKVNSGSVSQGHYVWAEGMPDWKVMTDIQDFRSLLAPSKPPSPPTAEALVKNGKLEFSPALESPPPEHHYTETTGSFDSLLNAAPVEDDVAPSLAVSENFQPEESLQLAPGDIPTEATPMPVEATPVESEIVPAQQIIQTQVNLQASPQLDPNTQGGLAFNQFEVERAHRMSLAQNQNKSGRGWNLDQDSEQPKARRGAPKLLLFLLLVGLGGAGYMGYLKPVFEHPQVKSALAAAKIKITPYLAGFADKLPFLNDLLSPIPTLKDVSIEDLALLRKTATSNLMQVGPKVAVAVAETDLRRPTFYVTSNMPDGVQFEVYIEGVGETLLNHFDFSARKRVVLMSNIAQTTAFEFQPGTALPQGNYLVTVYEVPSSDPNILNILASRPEASRQPPPRALQEGNGQRKKVVDFKYYFLGGLKDLTYENRLRDYHEKLQVQAKTEIEELAQYTATMGQMLTELMDSFNRVKNSGNKARIDAHLKQLNGKLAMLAQFEKEFLSWTPESIGVLKFHSNLYMGVKGAYEATRQVLTLQSDYFEKKIEKSSFDIQLGEAFSRSTDILTSTRAKIKKAAELGISPMGMPQRVE